MPAISLLGQAYNYVFIQSSDRAAFHVRYNDQLYQSAPAGYLFLPRLKQGDVLLRVGKADSSLLEQDLVIKSLEKNSGFLLTKNESSDWVLSTLKEAKKKDSGAPPVTSGEDSFGALLAKVTQDSTVISLGANQGSAKNKNGGVFTVKSAVKELSRAKTAKRYEYVFELEGREGRDTIQLIIERRNLKP